MQIWEDSADKRLRANRCFDQVLAKSGEASWTFEPGYPLLDRTILYEQQIKHSEGLYH